MLLLGRKRLVPAVSGFVILSLASSTHGASDSLEGLNQSYKMVQPLELTPKLSLQLKLHAFLLWSSVGFLMPIGVLLIRFSTNVKSAKAVRVLFYCHVAAQVTGVALATAAAALSITNFENAFNNTHQRIGLALYGLVWLQPLIGFLRPSTVRRLNPQGERGKAVAAEVVRLDTRPDVEAERSDGGSAASGDGGGLKRRRLSGEWR